MPWVWPMSIFLKVRKNQLSTTKLRNLTFIIALKFLEIDLYLLIICWLKFSLPFNLIFQTSVGWTTSIFSFLLPDIHLSNPLFFDQDNLWNLLWFIIILSFSNESTTLSDSHCKMLTFFTAVQIKWFGLIVSAIEAVTGEVL